MLFVKLIFRPWRYAFWSQILTVLTFSFLFVLFGLFFWLERGINPIASRLENEHVITAYLKPELDRDKQKKVVDQIRLALGSNVAQRAEFKLVSPDQFVEKLGKNHADLKEQVMALGDQMERVVPRYVSISGWLPDSAPKEVKRIQGVTKVDSSQNRYLPIASSFRSIQWVIRALALGLVLVVLNGLVHLIRMNQVFQKEVLSLMRLMGSGGLLLRAPGLFLGMFNGFLSGAVAASVWLFASTWFVDHVRTFAPLLMELPSPSAWIALALLVVGTSIGFLSGLMGYRKPSAM